MIEVRIKETGKKFQLKTSWNEVTLAEYFIINLAKDECEILSALSGMPYEFFFTSTAVEFSTLVKSRLLFIQKMDLVTYPVPKKLYINGRVIIPPTQLSGQTTFGQKIMIDGVLSDKIKDNETPTLNNMVVIILSVYLYPLITDKPITDIDAISDIEKEILSLPAIDALRLGSFFLDSIISPMNFGQLSYRIPAKVGNNRLVNWLARWLPDWITFRTFTQQKE